jgi:hypothetical protein
VTGPSGIDRVTTKRLRQIVAHGFTPERDVALYQHGELLAAADCYLAAGWDHDAAGDSANRPSEFPPLNWPWHSDWWKPSHDPTENLATAAALIAAEIDRQTLAATVAGQVR